MFSIFGRFSHDLGIDLGTANTLVHCKGRGIIIREPSVVAVDSETNEVLEIGAEAKQMIGRTPGNIIAIRPMKDGVIADFDITQSMLKYFIHKAIGYHSLVRPRIVVGVPSGVTEVEKRAVVDAAIQADLYVIIDWHILSDGNPNTYLKQAKKFFTKMAKKYRKKNNVIFEICNEPNGRGTWKNIKKYAKKIIPIIRKKAKNSIILVGTPAWCTRVDKAASSPLPKRYRKNVMYTAHFYANSHQELARRLVAKAKRKKAPVFVSEYGISSDTGNHGVNVEQADLWMELLNKYNISSCAWSLCNKNESSAFIKPGYKKAYGFSYSNLTASGRWLYDMLKNAYADPSSADSSTTEDDMAPSNDPEDGSNPVFTPAG